MKEKDISTSAEEQCDGQASTDLVNTRAAAQFLKLSCSVLRKDRNKRHLGIPYINFGPRAVRYSMQALREYMRARTVATPAGHSDER